MMGAQWTAQETQQAQEAILAGIASGMALVDILKAPSPVRLPSRITVYRWLHEDSAFFEKYETARNIQQIGIMVQCIRIADATQKGVVAFRAARRSINKLRLLAERLQPQTWGRVMPRKINVVVDRGCSGLVVG